MHRSWGDFMDNNEIYIDDNIDNCVFEDFFDVAEIQKLQDKVADALQIGTIITYPDGTPITAPSNFCDFCYKVIRKSELGLKNCMKSDAAFGKPNKGGPIISQCLSGGLLDGGVSIMVGDKHIANWLFGQVRDETIQFNEEISRKKRLN